MSAGRWLRGLRPRPPGGRTNGLPAWAAVLGAGVALAALALVADRLFGSPLSMGSGYCTLEWVTVPDHALSLVAAPTATRTWTLEQAVRALSDTEVDTLPVLDDDRLAGVVTLAGIVRLDEILGSTRPEADDTSA